LLNKGKLFRIGGDEFCLLLPNFSAAEASATAERIRKIVDSFPPFGCVVKVTASIGVADSETVELKTPEDLVHAADQAMYVAKFTGENRVCLYPPTPAEAEAAAENRKKPRR
jgi:diguanylate cyclase (GGDEF)-like protein